ncbi:gluconokinase [Rathayibacter sp. Leaf296]|uniref:gluconokinase n=1 Tax=Rathayibacter sp. Leaf296 TaxID=1736327 RepID=UPI000703BFCB|nr:gluconokinase [Rathayibacter sp. Leaf296]KQQ08741.1 gluconate kinase [Rathayibacter sp. Leaf296]
MSGADRHPIGPVVVMGVAGCGKSVVGEHLAERYGVPFVDADTLHPSSNIEKMRSGQPLTDEDRAPWLDLVADELGLRPDGILIACSALKRHYRDRLRRVAPGVRFIHLHGDEALLYQRLASRDGHFMPASLLQSQLATLEDLEVDEHGWTIDVAQPLPSVLVEATSALSGTREETA